MSEETEMNYGEAFRVRPGRKLRLKKIDPAYKGHHEAEATAAVEIEHYRQKMAKMQSLLYAEKKRSVLIVLQALDAGGKDGTVNHVLRTMKAMIQFRRYVATRSRARCTCNPESLEALCELMKSEIARSHEGTVGARRLRAKGHDLHMSETDCVAVQE